MDSTSQVRDSILMSVSLSKQIEIIEVGTLRHQTEHISRNNGETHLHLTRACVGHNAELRNTNAALCALLHNPNQGVVMALQDDNFEYRCEY